MDEDGDARDNGLGGCFTAGVKSVKRQKRFKHGAISCQIFGNSTDSFPFMNMIPHTQQARPS